MTKVRILTDFKSNYIILFDQQNWTRH